MLLLQRTIETFDQLIECLNQAVQDAEKLRRIVLISKTTGVVAASVGTILNVIGMVLIPFTVGLSVPILCGTGTALTVSGGLTSIGTTIADASIKIGQQDNIKRLLDEYEDSLKSSIEEYEKLNRSLKKCDEIEVQ